MGNNNQEQSVNEKLTTEEIKEKLQEKYKVIVSPKNQEAVMNNAKKVVDQVKENVNTIVNAGKEVAANPRLIGKAVADTFNKIGDNQDAIKGAFKSGFNMFISGLKEVKAGYQETRTKTGVSETVADEVVNDTPPKDKSSI